MLNAYARGLHAYQKGVMLEENPFPPDNADHAHWRTGW